MLWILWTLWRSEPPQSPACWSPPYTESALERTACVRSCINQACYADVYGDDPLEEVRLLRGWCWWWCGRVSWCWCWCWSRCWHEVQSGRDWREVELFQGVLPPGKLLLIIILLILIFILLFIIIIILLIIIIILLIITIIIILLIINAICCTGLVIELLQVLQRRRRPWVEHWRWAKRSKKQKLWLVNIIRFQRSDKKTMTC